MESLIKLEDTGFYTLSERRCRQASATSSLSRCELVLTSRCNFRCPYCRHIGGSDMPFSQAVSTLKLWCNDGLKNVRFSGGEPTLYPGIYDLTACAKAWGCERIALSTNGSAKQAVYDRLLRFGANDFSVSLDACCAEDGEKMSGGVKGAWEVIVDNLRYLAARTYVTVGVVLTKDNADSLARIVRFADSLGVSDIRVIPAAQNGEKLPSFSCESDLLQKYPILRYRFNNLLQGNKVRGLDYTDANRCGLVVDDMAVNHGFHYPCIIYMREGGEPIGRVGPDMRQERELWSICHNTHTDLICSKNCLDVCVQYNNDFTRFRSPV